jgi:hypothetical protein
MEPSVVEFPFLDMVVLFRSPVSGCGKEPREIVQSAGYAHMFFPFKMFDINLSPY